MDLTSALRTFVRVVDRGSMTAAARDLGVSQPAVSKLLKSLEAHTGARLIERTSRAMRPTSRGLALYEAAGGALITIDAAMETIRSGACGIDGPLRLHGPACIGERHLTRIAMAFQRKHPGVRVDLTIENRPADLIAENVDVAVRMWLPDDQSVIAKRLGASRRVLVASPDYVARHGPVRSRKNIGDHDLIVTDASLSRHGTLSLRNGRGSSEVPVKPIFRTNNANVLLEALRAGRGIGTAQVLLVADDLASGALVRVLPGYEIEPTDLYLTYPSSKLLRPTVRAFIDFAVPAIRRIDGIV